MDKKFIKEHGEDILCYRIRTARQKKRMLYEDLDKRLIQLHREGKELYRRKNNLEWEPLVPPVQKGWKRFFVLREDIARSKQADFFERILKKINTYERSHRRDFIVRKRKKGKKIYVVREQKLLSPDEYHFRKLKFSDAERQLFHEQYSFMKGRGKFIKRYVFNEPWRFVLRTRPNMITRVKKRDDEMESRLKKIDNYLEQHNYRSRLEKLLRGNCYRYWKRDDNEKYGWRSKCVKWWMDKIESE